MSISGNIFQHDKLYTIGIEEEYMLCDPDTGELIDRANEIMHSLDYILKPRYSYELILSEIEVNTSVCNSVADAIEEISFRSICWAIEFTSSANALICNFDCVLAYGDVRISYII